MLSYISDAVIGYDSNHTITFWNRAAEEIYGYNAAEVLGQLSNLLKPTYHISRDHLMDTVLKEGHLETESGRQTKDGRQIFVETHVISLRDEAGQNSGFIAIDRDITQRKKEEEALREARDYLDNLFNYANAPIIVWNPQFVITRFNHAFEHLTGIVALEALGKKLDILFPAESRDVSMDLIRKTSSGERWESVEIPIQHRDGTVRIVLWNSATVYGPDQITAIATIAQGHDITERKRAEADLKESEGKFRTVLENSQDGISMLDLANDRYVFMSPAQLALTGFSEQEISSITSEQIYARIHPDDREILRKQQERVIAGEDLSEPVEYRWKMKSGEYRWFSERRKLVRDEAGRPVALVGVSRDITDSKRLLERLAAQERLAYLGRMAGTIAHEVRNPLAVIDSSAYYLERKLSGTDEKITTHIQRMRNGVTRAANIIEKLLEMSRMRQPQLIKVNLDTFISKAIQQANVPHTVKVTFIHCPNPIEIMADVEQLGMALGNLIRNALEAMENSGTLTIGLSQAKGWVEILIADTGAGIPEDRQERVFEPLFTTKPGGVGFGLALVKTIVEQHNGRITFTSAPGKGTTFTIRLPQSPEPGL